MNANAKNIDCVSFSAAAQTFSTGGAGGSQAQAGAQTFSAGGPGGISGKEK